MTFNVHSLYKKIWPGGSFAVSFLHDSINCEHCMKGKIHFAPKVKNESKIQSYDPPGVEDLTKSCFHQRHLKSFRVITCNSIPESSFSTLGVKLTKPDAAVVLNQGCDDEKTVKNSLQNNRKKSTFQSIKSPCKTKNCENKKLKIKRSRTQNRKYIHKGLCDNYFPPLKTSLVKENKNVKKPKIPVKRNILPTNVIKTVKKPTKGTLKRKRWTLQKLKQSNQNYEDDLFEDQKFCSFESIIEDDSDSEKYEAMRTPQISLSPVRDGSSTPTCNDCYSPGELFSNRKEAEEYIYRREKRRRLKLQDERSETGVPAEKSKNTEEYTRNLLEKASEFLKKVAMKTEECEKESDEDEYFTDVSDNSD